MSTDFRKLLFEVSEALVTEELSGLKFLSQDHVPRGKLETIHEPKAFFEVLQEKDMIGTGNLFFLKELLYRIHRIDLLTAHLGSSREEMERELQIPGKAQVSDYRQLLYGIAEDLTSDDVRNVKFLLRKQLPKNKLQENASMLQVLLEMEINEKIKEDDLTMLKDILQGFRADIKKKIDAYEEKKGEKYSKEEVRYPVSVYPEEQGAEGKAAKQVEQPRQRGRPWNNSYVPDKTEPSLWEPDYQQPFKQDMNKQLSEETNLNDNGDWDIKVLARILLNRYEVNSRTPYITGIAQGPSEEMYGKIYKMKNNPHGYCLIINNHIFKNPRHNREGTLQDGEAVKRVFKWLQFETVEYMNLEGKKIYDTVEEYSKKDHRNMDCFVCFIFSHGEKDKIKGVDDECVNIEALVSRFTGTNCPSLAGKPKVFIIQACQGSERHPSVAVESDSSGHLEVDASPLTSIPDWADILIGKATVEDYLCYRSCKTGSVYIQSLCKKMELLCPQREDLATILTEVNNEVAGKELEGSKQMPKITSTLLKKLIFEVPQ